MPDDISISASIDDSGVKAATKRMGEDVTAFVNGAEAEFRSLGKAMKASDAELTRQATSALQKGAGRAGGGVGGSASYRIGQAALQSQDVAVQLQGGAKYSTIIAQQGSQIASIFGPGGAVLGGALAIGAAIYSWYTGEKDTAEEAKRLGQQFSELQKNAASMGKTAHDNLVNAAVSRESRVNGDAEGGRLRRAFEHEERLKKIREEAITGPEELRTVALAAENKAYDEEEERISELEAKKMAADSVAFAAKKKQRSADLSDALAEQDQIRAKLSGNESLELQADIKKLVLLRKQAEAMDGGVDRVKKTNEALHQQDAIVQKVTNSAQKANRASSDAAKALESAFDAASTMGQKAIDSITKWAAAAQKKIGKDIAEGIALAMAKTLAEGQKILNAADDLLNPQGAKDRKKNKKKQDRAIEEEINRELQREDNRGRNTPGARPRTPEERKREHDRRIHAADAARDRNDKLTIDPNDIQKLATAIANENQKLIAQ